MRLLAPFCLTLFLGAAPSPLHAEQHLIDIAEVYSNEDGTIQFIELVTLEDAVDMLAPTRLQAVNADGTEEHILKNFIAAFPALDAGTTMLVGSIGFAEAYPEVPPDFLFFDVDVSFHLDSGRVWFRHELIPCPDEVPDCEIDAVAYGDFTGDMGRFVVPAPALPSNGCDSLVRTRIAPWPSNKDDNSTDWVVGPATPRNSKGDTITIECLPSFQRGDADGDATTSALLDGLFILKHGFLGGDEPPCLDAADADGDGSFGALSDVLFLLRWGFVEGPAPPSPGPTDCGPDPAGKSPGCATPPATCN